MSYVKIDFYEILEVDKNSSLNEIKKSYRKLAFQYHPDRNPENPEALEKLKDINKAYEVLSDEGKRAQYDSYNQLTSDGFFNGEQSFGGFGSFFDDLFGEVFTPGMRNRPQRGRDLKYDLEIEFEDAVFGIEKEIVIPKRQHCETCSGRGAESGGELACSTCNGMGSIRYANGIFSINRTCSSCGGRGFVIVEPCGGCGGQGMVNIEHTVKVRVPAGVGNGMRLKIRNEGEIGTLNGSMGDLYVQIHVKDHDIFSRQDNDVFSEVPITLSQACLGSDIEIPTLEGLDSLKVPAGTQPGDIIKLSNKGVPFVGKPDGARGDLYIILQVEVPVDLDKATKELIEKLEGSSGEKSNPKISSFRDKLSTHFNKH